MRNKRSLVLGLLASMLAITSQAQAAIELPEGLTAHFTTMGTVVVGGVAVVALAAFGLKVVPMGLRFLGKVWRAVAGG